MKVTAHLSFLQPVGQGLGSQNSRRFISRKEMEEVWVEIAELRRQLTQLIGVEVITPQLGAATEQDAARAEVAALRRAIRHAREEAESPSERAINGSPIERVINIAKDEDTRQLQQNDAGRTKRLLKSTRVKKKKIPAAPLRAVDKALAALSTHRLGKTAKHFVCPATLGPRGGPHEFVEAKEEKAKRRKHADEAWAAVELRAGRGAPDETPGPGSHDVHYNDRGSKSVSHHTGKKASRRDLLALPPEGTACVLCQAKCWYGCACPCHEVCSDRRSESACGTIGTDTPTSRPDVAMTTADDVQPQKVARAPMWLRGLLGRADKENDFDVALPELDAALRRPQGDVNAAEARAVAVFLRAARDKSGSVRKWFESRQSTDSGQVPFSEFRNLLGVNDATEELRLLADNDSLAWDSLVRIVDRTLLAPRVAAGRILRSLSAKKERTVDLFERARRGMNAAVSAVALATVVMPCLGTLVEDFAGPLQVDPRPLNVPCPAECCTATCSYECRCECHNVKLMITTSTPEVMAPSDDEASQHKGLHLGARVEVRPLGVADVYFSGAVACVHNDKGEFDVHYDDGRYETGVTSLRLRQNIEESTQIIGKNESQEAVPCRLAKGSKRAEPPKQSSEANDAAVRPRTARGGVIEWRTPAPKQRSSKSDEKQLEEAPRCDLEQAERAIAKRPDIGVYAWSTTDRGLLPAETAETMDDQSAETPVSLHAATKPHVPGVLYAEPSTPPLMPTVATMSSAMAAGPGTYEPNWAAVFPRSHEARIFDDKKTAIKPRAALVVALKHRQNSCGPGDYMIERADAANSRHVRVRRAVIAPVARLAARHRPDEIAEALVAERKEARKRRRATILAQRSKRHAAAAERRKFRAWRRSKLTAAESKLASSSSSSDGGLMSQAAVEELAKLASSDDESAIKKADEPSRRKPVGAFIGPESSLPESVLRRRAQDAWRAARLGPCTYNVARSLSLVERTTTRGPTFGVETNSRSRKAKTRMAVLSGIRRAAEQAAAAARDTLLAPQLQHAWVMPTPAEDCKSSMAAYRRRLASSSKQVFAYVEKVATPILVRAKRERDEAAKVNRDARPSNRRSRQKIASVDISAGLGRDSIEIVRKGAALKSHFGSPTIRKSLRAPQYSKSVDVLAARKALEPAPKAAAAAFASTARDDTLGPTCSTTSDKRDGDVLDLSQPSPPKAHGFNFGRAIRFKETEKEVVEGEHLDLAADIEGSADFVNRSRWLCFAKQVNPREDRTSRDQDEGHLWLSPNHVERMATAYTFAQAPRFAADEGVEDNEKPKLALSPKSPKQRATTCLVDYAHDIEEWDGSNVWNTADFAEATAILISGDLDRAPLIDEASRAAKGGLQLAASIAHRRVPDLSAPRVARNDLQSKLGKPDKPNDDSVLPRGGVGVKLAGLDWARQAERWSITLESPERADRQCDGTDKPANDAVRGYVDWSRYENKGFTTHDSELIDRRHRSTEDPFLSAPPSQIYIEMEKQQSRSEIEDQPVREGDILKLSPARALARTEPKSQTVKFPPHLLQSEPTLTDKIWRIPSHSLCSSVYCSGNIADGRPEKVLRGDGTNLVIALARLKLAVNTATVHLGTTSVQ